MAEQRPARWWRGRILLTAVAAGVLVGGVALAGLYKLSTSPLLCNSCHIMKPYVEAWKTSKHSTVTCVSCHYPPGFRDTIWVKYQALAQVAKWATQTYSSKPFAEVEDGSCLRSGCHATRLLDGKVKFKREIIFDHGPHLKEERRGRQLRCTSCHSQIVVGTHIEVTTSTCFLCHFKGKKNPREFDPLGGCPICHSVPKGDIEVMEGVIFNHESMVKRKVACEKCHLNVVEGNGEASRERCYTCHNQPEKLEKYGDTVFMHDFHVSTHNIECGRCHSEIKHELPPPIGLTVSWLLDSLFGPSSAEAEVQTSPLHPKSIGKPPAGKEPESRPKKAGRELDCKGCHQGFHRGVLQMYMGMSGKGTPIIPSHMLQVRVECVACHEEPKEEGVKAAMLGQTFRPSESACLDCHGEKYRGMLDDWTKTIKVMLDAVKGKLEVVGKALSATDPSHPRLARPKKLVSDARFNVELVELGRGVHNVFFAADLLKVANGYLDEAMVAIGKPPVKSAEETLVLGGYCAVLCHKKAGVVQSETVKFGTETVPHVRHVTEFGVTCTVCHSAEKHQAVTATKSSCLACHHREGNKNERCLACHRLQQAFFTGTVEEEKESEEEPVPSPHAELTDCVGCHDVKVKHSRSAVAKMCLECHDESYLSSLEEWTNGVERGLREVRGLIKKAEAGLRRARKDPKAPEVRDLLEAARADAELVARARGAHNPELAMAILAKAKKTAGQAVGLVSRQAR